MGQVCVFMTHVVNGESTHWVNAINGSGYMEHMLHKLNLSGCLTGFDYQFLKLPCMEILIVALRVAGTIASYQSISQSDNLSTLVHKSLSLVNYSYICAKNIQILCSANFSLI